MGLHQEVSQILDNNIQRIVRPAQLYTNVVGAYNLFAVRDGPIMALKLVGMHTAASGGAATLAVTLTGGIGMDAGAVAINGAVGTVVNVGLNVATVQAGAAVGIPNTDALFYPKGTTIGLQAALAPTFIIGTFAVSTVTMLWVLLYYKLTPESHVEVS